SVKPLAYRPQSRPYFSSIKHTLVPFLLCCIPLLKAVLMLKNTSAMDPLRQDITAVLEECYSRGMQLSYLFVSVSLDGKVMAVRFTEAENGEGLDAQPIAGNPNALATMPMPLNVMIVDATGQATCALISGPGQVTFRYS